MTARWIVVTGLILSLGCQYQDRPVGGKQACAALPLKQCPTDYYCASDQKCWPLGSGPATDGGADSRLDAPIAIDAPDAPAMPDAGAGIDASRDQSMDMASRTDATGDVGTSVNGQTCTTGANCASGNCVESVCCDTPCADVCMSCRNVLTASSPDGTCAAIGSGKDDPKGRCGAATVATSCGNTGHCDGKGACDKFGGTTTCLTAACVDGGFQPAATCDGKGNCPAASPQSCAGFACTAAGGCATSCSSDLMCTGGYCASTGTCAAKKIDGSSCVASNECVHGQCVSGVCCETACTGLCMSCAVADTTQASGLCRPIKSGGSSAGKCAVDPATCGHDGTCDGKGACRFVASGTTCGTTACTSAQLRAAPTCNGTGTCVTPTTTSGCPGGVVCASTTACLGPACSADGDCVSNFCVSASCAPKKGNGQTCASARECSSGNCIDTVCCNAACNGSCQFCNASGNPGVCTNVTGAPLAGHAPCTGTGACVGTCNGQGPSCVLPGATTTCRSASCTGGVATAAAVCDGAGNCPPASTKTCDPLVCGATACKTTCAVQTDCIAADYCAGSTCQPKKGLGALCVSGFECSQGICGGRCCATAPCTCPQPTPGNLLFSSNAGFDTNVVGWNTSGGLVWNGDDADGCPFSGSSLLSAGGSGDPQRCIAITPGTTYDIGGWFKNSSGQLYDCIFSTWTTANCGATSTQFQEFTGTNTNWVAKTSLIQAGPSDIALLIECDSNLNSFVDKLFVTPAPGLY